MVSRRVAISCVLLISMLSQTGCSCRRRNAFRVQNSCCTPAPRSSCCEPATSYKRFDGSLEPMPAPVMSAPPTMIQQR